MKQFTKTEFFDEYGRKRMIVKVHDDDIEVGDYQLMCPEEMDIAADYQRRGYEIASVFEMEDQEDVVILDNDLGSSFHKIGYIIVDRRHIS